MKNIFYIHEFINLVCNKRQIDFFPPSEIDSAIDLAQRGMFKELYKIYEATEEISDSLVPFLSDPTTLTLTNGEATKPTDFVHKASLTANGVTVEVIDQMFRGMKEVDAICPPTILFPIAYSYNDKFVFSPTNLTNVKLVYLKEPTIPFFAFTVVDDKIVYNDSASIDVGWNDIDISQLSYEALKILGITIREADIFQFGQAQSNDIKTDAKV